MFGKNCISNEKPEVGMMSSSVCKHKTYTTYLGNLEVTTQDLIL